MRRIDWGNQFKRDFKRESKGQHRSTIDDDFFPIVELLALDQNLETRLRDHALGGNWSGHRDCHIKPDLILIYRKPDADSLQLVRIGSHSELGI
jgi:mRNA interferase YafQ